MTDQPDLSRRRPLAGLPLLPTTFGLSLPGSEVAAGAEATVPDDPRQPRFESTEHIANFYQLARS